MIKSFRGKMISVMISYTIFITMFSGILFYEGLHRSENGYLKSVINYHLSAINQQDLPLTPIKLDLNTTLYRLNDAQLPDYVVESELGEYEHEMTELHYRIALHPSGEKIVIVHEDVAKLLDDQESYLEGVIATLVLVSVVIGSILVSYLVVLMTRRVVSLSDRVDEAIENGSAIRRKSQHSSDEIDNLEEALAGYSEKLLAFIEREKHFTRHASHELRTPISVIRNSYHLLLSTQLDDKQKKLVERIGKSSDKAKNLTSAFLMLARHHSQSPEEVDVTALIGKVIQDNSTQLEANHLIVATQLKAVSLSSYEPLLDILLNNIITNVINHGVDSINITLNEAEIIITNGAESPPREQGFGTDICHQICDFLGYQFITDYSENIYTAKIVLKH